MVGAFADLLAIMVAAAQLGDSQAVAVNASEVTHRYRTALLEGANDRD